MASACVFVVTIFKSSDQDGDFSKWHFGFFGNSNLKSNKPISMKFGGKILDQIMLDMNFWDDIVFLKAFFRHN